MNFSIYSSYLVLYLTQYDCVYLAQYDCVYLAVTTFAFIGMVTSIQMFISLYIRQQITWDSESDEEDELAYTPLLTSTEEESDSEEFDEMFNTVIEELMRTFGENVELVTPTDNEVEVVEEEDYDAIDDGKFEISDENFEKFVDDLRKNLGMERDFRPLFSRFE